MTLLRSFESTYNKAVRCQRWQLTQFVTDAKHC
jgi:hypothetical protein